MLTTFEIVVARYQEDIDWVYTIPHTVWLYNKGGDSQPLNLPDQVTWQCLPNVGREFGTYLHHIVSRWSSLADMTLFLQGSPCPAKHDAVLPSWEEYNRPEQGYVSVHDFTEHRDVDDHWHNERFGHCSLLSRDKHAFYQLIGVDVPMVSSFNHGAQFAVSRERIHIRGFAFWEKLAVLALQQSLTLSLRCYSNYEVGCLFERAWPYICILNR